MITAPTLAPWPQLRRAHEPLKTPACVRPPAWMTEICRGVSVGVCIAAGTELENRLGGDVAGHAHAGEWLKPSQDWICVAAWPLALARDYRPSETLLHEYAHLLNPYDGHGELWRETFEALMSRFGGTE